MKNKTITAGLLGIILGLFITFFAVKDITFPSGQPIINQLNNIIIYAQQENWSQADKEANALISEWNKKQYLLSLNYAEVDFYLFMDNLSRIQGAIKTRDVAETVSQSLSTLKLWKNFIKLIPNP